jgi:hypothetical protein
MRERVLSDTVHLLPFRNRKSYLAIDNIYCFKMPNGNIIQLPKEKVKIAQECSSELFIFNVSMYDIDYDRLPNILKVILKKLTENLLYTHEYILGHEDMGKSDPNVFL